MATPLQIQEHVSDCPAGPHQQSRRRHELPCATWKWSATRFLATFRAKTGYTRGIRPEVQVFRCKLSPASTYHTEEGVEVDPDRCRRATVMRGALPLARRPEGRMVMDTM